MERLDIGRQHFAAFGNVNGGIALGAKVSAHAASMGTVAHWCGGGLWGDSGSASRGGVLEVSVDGGVNSGCRGALVCVQ